MNVKKYLHVFSVSTILAMVGISEAAAEDFDLTIALDGIEHVSKGSHVRPGDYLRLDTYLTNNGPDPAPGRISVTGEVLPTCPYLVGWYLSADSIISNDDIQIGGFCPNGLEAGQTLRFWADVFVPVNIEGGFYYFGAIADYNNTVSETDESNNTTIGKLTNVR